MLEYNLKLFSFERKFAMAEENVRKKNENKPKDEFGWDEAPVSIHQDHPSSVNLKLIFF